MLKRITLLASLAVVLAAVTAAPAFAEGTAWSNTGALGIKGTLTLKRDGASAVTCTISGAPFIAENYGNEATYYVNLWPNTPTKCSNGENWQYASAGSVQGSSPFSLDGFAAGLGGQAAPWKETYSGTGSAVPFVNGSGSVMSHIDFKETWIGILSSGKKLTATGSLEIYRPGNLLVTVKAL